MADEPVVDADVVDDDLPQTDPPWERGTAVERRQGPGVAPAVTAGQLSDRLAVIQQASQQAMKEDVDFGIVPGTKKPTLFKPGAEKLGVLFELDVQLHNEKTWDGDHLTVVSTATVYHAPSGSRMGSGEGICSTREKKYAVRRQDRVCPDCGEPQVRQSNHDDEWFCWRKKGGCGHKWPNDSDQGRAFDAMQVGEVPNPDLADTWNTVNKMAEKRARVDAILAVTGASALFTQDVEDGQPPVDRSDSAAPFGPPLPDNQVGKFQEAAAYLMEHGEGPDDELAAQLQAKLIEDSDGYLPRQAARAIIWAASTLKNAIESSDTDASDAGGKE